MDSNKPLIVVIVLLVLVSLGLGGYIAYEKLFITENKEECKTVIDDVSIDINKLYNIGDILNKLDNAFNTGDKYLGYIYNSKIIDIKDFDKNAALYASIYSDLVRSNTENTISSERIKNRYEMIFGKAIEYNPTSIDLGDNINITYDDNEKLFKYRASIINNDHKDEYLVENTNTKLKEDLVVVTRKVFYVSYDNKKAIIYTNSSKQNKLGEVSLKNGEISTKEVVGKYGSKLNTYEFTFKLGDTDEYNLHKIERTN